MYEQLSLFASQASRNGECVERKGKRLTWGEIIPGMAAVYDCSTQSHEWLMVTTVQEIVQTPDGLRVILDGGRKSRPMVNRRYIDTGSVKLYREAT